MTVDPVNEEQKLVIIIAFGKLTKGRNKGNLEDN